MSWHNCWKFMLPLCTICKHWQSNLQHSESPWLSSLSRNTYLCGLGSSSKWWIVSWVDLFYCFLNKHFTIWVIWMSIMLPRSVRPSRSWHLHKSSTPLSWMLLEGAWLTRPNPDTACVRESANVTSSQLARCAKQEYYCSKNAWNMFTHSTRVCILNLVAIGSKMSEIFEVSEEGGVSEHPVRHSTWVVVWCVVEATEKF